MRSDCYGDMAMAGEIEREFTVAAQSHKLSFDDLATGMGYQPVRIRRVIGAVTTPRQVRIAIALMVSEHENVELLGEAYIRELNPGMPPGLSAQSQVDWLALPRLERMGWDLLMGVGR